MRGLFLGLLMVGFAPHAWALVSASVNAPSPVNPNAGYTVNASGTDDFGDLQTLTVTKNGQYFGSISRNFWDYTCYSLSLSGGATAPGSPSPTTYVAYADTTNYSATGSCVVIVRANQTVSGANATITYGQSFTPTYSGGAGTGAWQFCIADYTNWPGTDGIGTGQTGTLLWPSNTVSTSWPAYGAGTYLFWIRKLGDTYTNDSNIPNYTLTVNKANQPAVTITSAASFTYGNSYTATASGGAGTGAIVWALGTGSTAAGAAVNSSTGAVTANSTGTVVVKAYRAGDSNYNQSATTSNFTITVNSRPITVTLSGSKAYNGTTSPTGASAAVTSGSLAPGDSFSYSIANTSSANAGTYTGLTTATITNGSAPTTRTSSYTISYTGSYTIAKANQAPVTISGSSFTYGNSYAATAFGGSGTGAIVWSLGSGSTAAGAAINSSTGAVSASSTGSVVVRAYRAGDSNYNQSATTSDLTILVYPRPITVTLSGSKTYNGSTATTGLGAAITAGSLAAGDSLTASSATTSSANAGSYNSVTSLAITNASAPTTRTASYVIAFAGAYTINKAEQAAVNITSGTSFTYGSSYTATASGGSGTGAIVWSLGTGSTAAGAAINSSTGAVTVNSTGTAVVKAYRAGDSNYNQSATTSNFTIAVNPRPITVTLSGSKAYNGTTSPTGVSAVITSGSLGPGDTIGYSFGNTPSAGVGNYTGLASATVSNASTPTDRTGSYSISYNGSYSINKANQAAVSITSGTSFANGSSYTATAAGGSGTGAFVWSLGTGSTAAGAAINSTTGAVTANSIGTVVIKVYRTGDANYYQSATTSDFTITVTNNAPDSLTIDPSSYAIKQGEGIALTSQAHDMDGNMTSHHFWRRGPKATSAFQDPDDVWVQDTTELSNWSNYSNPGLPSGSTNSSISGTFTPTAPGFWQFHANAGDAAGAGGNGASTDPVFVAPLPSLTLSSSATNGATASGGGTLNISVDDTVTVTADAIAAGWLSEMQILRWTGGFSDTPSNLTTLASGWETGANTATSASRNASWTPGVAGTYTLYGEAFTGRTGGERINGVSGWVNYFNPPDPNSLRILVKVFSNPSVSLQILDSTGAPIGVSGDGKVHIPWNEQFKVRVQGAQSESILSALLARFQKPGQIAGPSGINGGFSFDGATYTKAFSVSGASASCDSTLITADTAGEWAAWVHASTTAAAGWGSVGGWDGNHYGWATASMSITVDPQPVTLAVTNTMLIYNGTTQGPTVTPAGSFTISNGVASAVDHGTYTFTATPAGNYSGAPLTCTWSIEKANRWVTLTPLNSGVTVGGSVTFTANGGSSYTWGGAASGSGAVKSVAFNSTGAFTVTVQDQGSLNYNPSNTATATIVVDVDSDLDGLTDAEETMLGTDPNVFDADQSTEFNLKITTPR